MTDNQRQAEEVEKMEKTTHMVLAYGERCRREGEQAGRALRRWLHKDEREGGTKMQGGEITMKIGDAARERRHRKWALKELLRQWRNFGRACDRLEEYEKRHRRDKQAIERLGMRIEAAEKEARTAAVYQRERVGALQKIIGNGPKSSLDYAEDGRYVWPEWWHKIQVDLKRLLVSAPPEEPLAALRAESQEKEESHG